MKRIPVNYWEENYTKQPTLIQRAWVQRWFELLDINVGYIYSPPAVHAFLILEELVHGFEKDIPRTQGHLLEELYYCYQIDPTLRDDQKFGEEIRKLLRTTDKNKRKDDIHKFITEETVIRMSIHDALEWYQGGGYRVLLIEKLQELLVVEPIGDRVRHYRDVNVVSQNLITELLLYNKYSVAFLSTSCVEMFLRPHTSDTGKSDFSERLQQFLSKFYQEQHEFTVYMRLQVHRFARHVRQVGNITFEESIGSLCEHEKNVVDHIKAISGREKWHTKEKKRAKDFFYYGHPSDNQIFAVAKGILAEDAGSAAMQAQERLAVALQQTRFEYELRGFNVDSRMFVYNKTCDTLKFMSIKDILRTRHGIPGNPLRFERLVQLLSSISEVCCSSTQENQEQQEKSEHVVNNVTRTALAWHRDALDADTAESQFLNHWIGLEQIFEPMNPEQSHATDVVKAMAKFLHTKRTTQLLLDLWGDIQRVGLLGNTRIVASVDGHVEYSTALLRAKKIGNLCRVRYNDNSRPELYLVSQDGKRHTFQLYPGAIVLVPDGVKVSTGWWLAGDFLKPDTNSKLRHLFQDDTRFSAENLLYLAFYEKQFTSQNYKVPFSMSKGAIDTWLSEPSAITMAIEAMRWFDNLVRLCSNTEGKQNNPLVFIRRIKEDQSKLQTEWCSRIIVDMPKYMQFFDLYEELYKYNKRTLPDMALFEAYRNLTPDIKTMKSVFGEIGFNVLTDQPLLEFRIAEVKNYLQNKTQVPDMPLLKAEIDRMRRVRNGMVHRAHIPPNLNLLVTYIYKYARLYLREVLYNMATNPELTVEEWLYLKVR